MAADNGRPRGKQQMHNEMEAEILVVDRLYVG